MWECKWQITKALWGRILTVAQKIYASGKFKLNLHKIYVKSMLNLY